MISAWKNFPKKYCGISTYYEWHFKPQISSIFHFDGVSDGQMAHILGVKLDVVWKELSMHTIDTILKSWEGN